MLDPSGWNPFGQLGDGTEVSSNSPVQVRLPVPAAQVSDGGSGFTNGQSLALLADGQVWGWGNDGFGQLGNGVTARIVSKPVQATVLEHHAIVSVISGGDHSLVLDSSGNVYGFGDNLEGQVGGGSTHSPVLRPIKVLSGVSAISSTEYDSLALLRAAPSQSSSS